MNGNFYSKSIKRRKSNVEFIDIGKTEDLAAPGEPIERMNGLYSVSARVASAIIEWIENFI